MQRRGVGVTRYFSLLQSVHHKLKGDYPANYNKLVGHVLWEQMQLKQVIVG